MRAAFLRNSQKKYGIGPVICDPSRPETIEFFDHEGRDYGIEASKYTHKREEGIAELGCRFPKAGDDKPRIYVNSKVC